MIPRVSLSRAALVLFSLCAACAPSPLVRSAQMGDWRALASLLEARLKAGDVSASEVRNVSRATIDFELSAGSDADVLARLGELSNCAGLIVPFLDERKNKHDGIGAHAATMLFELGKLAPDDVRGWADDDDAQWRALGVRGLVRNGDGEKRAKALVDPDGRVRLSAVFAVRDAGEVAEAPLLIEVARLDSESLNRLHAIRAIAASPSAGAKEVCALRDIWEGADDALRREIALAWVTSTSLFLGGGRERLIAILAAGGLSGPTIAAAAAVTRLRRNDKEIDQLAVTVLERALTHGSLLDKIHVLSAAVIDHSSVLQDAVKKLADETEVEVRVAAHIKLAGLAHTRKASVAALFVIANDAGHALTHQARLALARLEERDVIALLERDLGDASTAVKISAADALATLGEHPRAARVIADGNVSVRVRAACSLGR